MAQRVWGVIDGVPVLELGAGGLVTVIVLLILSGRLVPTSWVTRLLAQAAVEKEAVAVERDHWRAAHETTLAQNTLLMQQANLSAKAMQALPKPPQAGDTR